MVEAVVKMERYKMRKILNTLAKKLSRAGVLTAVAAVLLVPQMAYSQAVEENPSALAMTGDLVVARPILLATTVLGSVAYVVSLPFSLAGGNAEEAADLSLIHISEPTRPY